MNRFIFVGLCILAGPVLPAQSSANDGGMDKRVDVSECVGLNNDAERLTCFDKVTKRPSEPMPTWREPSARKLANTDDPSPNETLRKAIKDGMELSYFTFGSGQAVGADRTTSKMLYEGQIFHNLSLASKTIGNVDFWLDVPIRIGLRHLTLPSMPVRTPSYNPGLRLYFAGHDDIPSADHEKWYFSAGLHHYSNGQDGAAINARDGTVNTRNGTFNTNYAEIAANRYRRGDTIENARIGFRQHFYGTFDDAQPGQYERRHVSLELQSKTYRPFDNIGMLKDWTAQLRAAETFGWGYQYVIKNDVTPALNVETRTADRFNTTIEFLARRDHWKDLAFYVRYDYGYDYYNINFQNRINRIQFGLAAKSF